MAYAKELFDRYFPQLYMQQIDVSQVAAYSVDENRRKLLEYAFEKAAIARKGADWRYIGGIMERLAVRGIETIEQARQWDDERPDVNGTGDCDYSETLAYAEKLMGKESHNGLQ